MTVVLIRTYFTLTLSHLTFSSTTSAIPGLQTKYKIELFFVIFLAIYKIHITLFYIFFSSVLIISFGDLEQTCTPTACHFI